jgi:hypothetical protein
MFSKTVQNLQENSTLLKFNSDLQLFWKDRNVSNYLILMETINNQVVCVKYVVKFVVLKI